MPFRGRVSRIAGGGIGVSSRRGVQAVQSLHGGVCRVSYIDTLEAVLRLGYRIQQIGIGFPPSRGVGFVISS